MILEDMNDYLDRVMNLNDITRYTVIFLSIIVVITVALRIVLSIFYQGQLTAVRFSKKDKRSALLNKIINDYKIASDKGIANVNTNQIVMKYVRKLNFIGWSLDSIDSFIKKVETQAAFIAIAAIFLPETDKLWCAGITALMLIVFWLIGSVFDYESTRAKLDVELIDYVDNVEGVFYSKDIGSTILSLKNELQVAIFNTNKSLTDAIYKLNSSVNESFKYGTDHMVRTMETSMNSLVNYATVLKEPMEAWKQNIEQASKLQSGLNSTSQDLKQAMDKFSEIYGRLDQQLTNQSTDMKEVYVSLRKQIEQLFTVVNNIDENSKTVTINNEALQKQLKYIDDNQEVLNITLQKYQGTIEEFTANIGEVFSNIVTLYSQNATTSITSGMQEFSNKLIETNREFLSSINESIEQLSRQNMIGQQSVLDMKKQLEDSLGDEIISRGE
jgi:hypothetical protein